MALLPCAQAAAIDPLIEGAKLCTQHLSRYEREYGIPTHLLSAIASTESGRYHDGLKIRIPWPWTINAEGKGYYFDSKDEAIAAVRKLHAQGVQSIDVGCMQVNLHHHPQAFASLDQAFEPETNIAYAAGFLRGLYNEENSWKKAAADYHSKTPKLGNEYVGLVYDSWYNIIDKLRAARLEVPGAAVAAMNAMKNDPGVIQVASAQPKPVATAMKVTRLPEQRGRKVAAYKHPHMNSISVTSVETNDNHHDNGVIVVHPDIKVVDSEPEVRTVPATIVMAQAPVQPTTASVPNTRIISAASQQTTPATSPAPRKSGPTFIFND